ncbi:MAG: dipeptide ABC transporter ATP-binding protein [Gemmatimonadota bacterium]|nr:MAG: dipeptide ABC transporter ATP-binding protein [Gemmatimonadota bacterium]
MSSREAEVLLDVVDLSMHFSARDGATGRVRGLVKAVDGISFRLRRGETLGLVGESGCGKSTTARALLRLLEPTGGRVLFDGVDVLSMDARTLRAFRGRAQIVFQDPFGSLNPRLTAGGMLEEVLKVHDLAGDAAGRGRRALELLEMVGLSAEHAGRYPHEFSGGQRQRLGIARALSVEPEFIVLDEAVSALDVSVQAQILNLLSDLKADLGLAYLFIAHDLAVVEHLCDRVAVMYLGKIVEFGPSERLYQTPRHPYTKALLAAVPALARKSEPGNERTMLTGDPPSSMNPPSGCVFHPRCFHAKKDEECFRDMPDLAECGEGCFVACIKEWSRRGGGA